MTTNPSKPIVDRCPVCLGNGVISNVHVIEVYLGHSLPFAHYEMCPYCQGLGFIKPGHRDPNLQQFSVKGSTH